MPCVKTCEHCGGDFHAASNVAKYCDECKTRTCHHCGQDFVGNNPPERTERFCSSDCYEASREEKAPEPQECEHCGEEYTPRRCDQEGSRFCSKKCQGKWLGHHIWENGLNYDGDYEWFEGNDFREGKTPANAFSSEEVSGSNNPRWTERLNFTCEYCGETFEKVQWEAKRDDTANKYCSAECRDQWRSENLCGSNNPQYVGNPDSYRGRGWKQIRKEVVFQQGGCCKQCGKHVGKSLPVHHKKPFREFDEAEEANRRGNLVGLCQSCHMQIEHGTLKPNYQAG